MHLPILISIVILLLLSVSLLGSVSISSNQISIEPASKNLVIPTGNESSGVVAVKGPYTIDKALENEEHLIRLPESAVSTLGAAYGDSIYIGQEKYRLEQSLEGEGDLVRIPEAARDSLELTSGTVVRDSDFKSLFEDCYVVNNIAADGDKSVPGGGNNSTASVDLNSTNCSVGTSVSPRAYPGKILSLYVNDTKIGDVSGSVSNGTYSVYLNDAYSDSFYLNSSSAGLIYNETYGNSSVRLVLEDSSANTTSMFADADSYVRFVNINISNSNSSR